jgi:hypothetical protein
LAWAGFNPRISPICWINKQPGVIQITDRRRLQA